MNTIHILKSENSEKLGRYLSKIYTDLAAYSEEVCAVDLTNTYNETLHYEFRSVSCIMGDSKCILVSKADKPEIQILGVNFIGFNPLEPEWVVSAFTLPIEKIKLSSCGDKFFLEATKPFKESELTDVYFRIPAEW